MFNPGTKTLAPKSRRTLLRKLHRERKDDTALFLTSEVERVIKDTKSSKACGPDGLSAIMLKHLGEKAIDFLTSLLNASIASSVIPDIWKVARIVPLPKPGKPAGEGSSYRPISLLSPVAKLLEKLVLPEVQASFAIPSSQHGFRKGHSTTTALLNLTSHIQAGLNKKKPCDRTVVVALDLKRAFDTVDHDQLNADIMETTMPTSVKRWTINYLRGRQTFVEYQNAKSKLRKLKAGVPQGGVLSPILFNLYLSSIPKPTNGVYLISYADDCTVFASGTDIASICAKINAYLESLHEWLTYRKLELSASKSTVTLFTTFSGDYKNEL